MPVRIVEWKLPYTWWTWIEIDTDKVISLLLREENNLIMVNDDNEVYTDLQLESGLTPSSDFPVWVTVWKVLQADWWTQSWLILNWKTTSWDYARWIYANDWNLYFDNWTGTWKQVWYSTQVQAAIAALRDEIYEYFMKYEDFHWATPTWVNITLDLNTEYEPTADFIVNAPAEIQEWQTYILRVTSWATSYVMSLWENIINLQWANINLTQNATDMFVFLALDWVLELQKDINPNGVWTPNDWQLTIQKNGTQIWVFTADQATNTVVNVEVPTVVDALNSSSTTNALSANQWSVLKWMIDDLAGFGKFLSLWNASTWMPISFPLATPYTYSTWDYFVVEVVSSATPPVNYRPNGSSYAWTASSTPETDELEVWDVYVYDGSIWLLQSNHWKTVTFWNIAWDPYDNTNLAAALWDKQDVLTAWSNITIDPVTNEISASNTTYSSATSLVAWIVKLWNDTAISDTIAQPWTATWKTYPVQLNASGQMWVNVPRTNTTYWAWTWISIDWNNDIQNTWVTSVNWNTWAVTVTDTTYTAWTGIEIKNWLDYSAMQWPSPDGYHIPSKNERVALCSILTSTFWLTGNAAMMESVLKMPRAGYRSFASAGITDQGDYASYWSCTAYINGRAYSLDFESTSLSPQHDNYRSYGYSVRCFKDTPVTPDSGWTTLHDWSSVATGAWVFRDATNWLISISWDWSNWTTIMDKNLWATEVFTPWPWTSFTQANCWNYYQRWNNYGFPRTWTVTTSSTQVDASTYWPWNYYSSSTFIEAYDWSSVQNDNLRWWETWVVTLNNAITNTWVLSVNWQTWNVTISWWWIQNDTTWTTTTVTAIRAWTEAEYNSLWSHSASVIYHIY